MTDRTAFSILLLSIVAAAGLVKGVDAAWIFAAITAALALIAEELRMYAMTRVGEQDLGGGQWTIVDTPASRNAGKVAFVVAVISWATGLTAAVSLL